MASLPTPDRNRRIDRRASLVVAMPTQIAFTRPGLGDARLPWAVVEVFQHIA